jgi:hypothetical protein
VPVSVDSRMYSVRKETAGRYLRDLRAGRYQAPASVFCSRELENGLNIYVEDCITNHMIPTDDDLRARACQILGVDHTAADEPKLLERFKAMHVLWQQDSGADASDYLGNMGQIAPGQLPDYSLPNFTGDVNMYAAFGQHMDSMDFSTDFSAGMIAPCGQAQKEMASEMDDALFEFEGIVGMTGGTSSALRRKASNKLAEASGFANPIGK